MKAAIGSRLQRVRRAGPAVPTPTLTRGLSHAAGADLNIDLTWSSDAPPAGTTRTGWALDTITAGVTITETLAAATTSTTKALSAASERAYRVRAVYGTVTSPLSAAVSSALAGERMRVALTTGTTEDEVYRASPAEGSILAGAFETSDGLVLNRIRLNATGTQLIFNRSLADSTIKGDVYDYIPLSEALTRLAEQSNSLWCVDPYRDLVFHARDAVTPSPITVDERRNLARIVRKVDRQHWRNVQTVIGSTPAAGQRREDFTGDDMRQEFALQYRVDKIVQVSVNGASQGFSAPDDPWSVDRARSVLVHAPSQTPLGATETVEVVYNYNFPIVVTRENAPSMAAWRRIHRVEQDAALDTIELVETRAEALLARHDFPTSVLEIETPPGAVVGLAEGTVVPVEIPSLGITGERWLVDRITITERTTHLVYRARLLARDHETLYEDYWDRLQRNTVPTELTRQQAPDQTDPIDPAVLGLEGLRLPALLGGDYATRLRHTDWRAIPGATIARLNGRRLPSALVEWYATAQLVGGGRGELRLYNRTRGTARGGTVTVSGTNAEVVFIRRITLSADLSDYELQARVTATPSLREHGLSVWGAVLDVGD